MDTRDLSHNDFSHIVYRTTTTSVCMEPGVLDSSWVVVQEHNGKPICMECFQILNAHNAKAYEEEGHMRDFTIREKIGPSRGVVYAIAGTMLVYTLVILIAIWVSRG